jgi:hypothetical protein
MQFVKWTTEGAVKGYQQYSRVFSDVKHTLVAGNMIVFLKEQEISAYI